MHARPSSRSRHVAAFVAVLSASLIAPRTVGAQAQVGFDPAVPVAFEPFTVTVSADSCAANTDTTADLAFGSIKTTGYIPDVVASQTVTSDANGVATFELSARAYPGRWLVFLGDACGSPVGFEIPPPVGFAASIAPVTVRVGVPTIIDVSGTGCPGSRGVWQALQPDLVQATGSAPTSAAGDWSGSSTMVIPDGPRWDWFRSGSGQDALRVGCLVDGFVVPYGDATGVTNVTILPPERAAGDASPSSAPGAVSPRFTG